MASQTERLLARARERFAVQDYYGTVHLLEEIVASGRAFADVHHLLGVSLSLLGQSQEALAQFARALELNPRYLEALIHQGLVLSELGRTRGKPRSRSAAPRPAWRRHRAGLPAPVAARLANQHAELADAYAEAGALARAIEQYERALELGPAFHDLRYRMARVMLEAGRPLEAREALEEVLRARPNFVDAEAALGLAHFLSGDAVGAREVWRGLPHPPAGECPGGGLPRDAGTHRGVRRGAGRASRGARAGDRAAGLRRAEPTTSVWATGPTARPGTTMRSPSTGRPSGAGPTPRGGPSSAPPRCTRGELRQSADAYVRMAGDDPTRRAEAAEGLESVARWRSGRGTRMSCRRS